MMTLLDRARLADQRRLGAQPEDHAARGLDCLTAGLESLVLARAAIAEGRPSWLPDAARALAEIAVGLAQAGADAGMLLDDGLRQIEAERC